MRLKHWLDKEGRGAARRLERDSQVSLTTIRELAETGRAVRDLRIARKLSRGTLGAVSVAELMQLRASDLVGVQPELERAS